MAAPLKKLTSIVQKASAKHTATVIFIHGLGDSGAGWAPVGEQLGEVLPHVKFIFPNAPSMPVTLNYGMKMPSWYDIKELSSINQEQDEDGMLKSRQQLMQIVREEVEENGIPANRIVVGGFSQGCVMGLLTGLTSEYKFAGIVSFSGYMPLHNKIMNMATDANRKTPILWGHGDADQVVNYDYGVQSVELLKKNKFNVKFNTYRNMGHGSCPQEIRDLLAFLKETIPPTADAATA
ncbi:Phospholipase/carboxylesterase/thioesterase [Dissophora ornata]|nr:Phospholipase/carboxylesterase/thioesterase [Dissophora ornata]